MKTLYAAAFFAVLGLPAFAQPMPDLPRLTFPDPAPTSQGCTAATTPSVCLR
ncbi:hypothetical protein SAMN05216227_1001150 [Pseudorhodobacter antarcticus]|uniref:Uncharacterized protein n=1 Tax=Pseudorhodobacter antarcticus TaxID=1077947 RepID=A0A1H8AI56_9RHOB|nr:hypothetical protein [Pseudorhodobacter antarcticus]SEM70455.1 hypothetical protein SAMN05216227_1001150 [Pseudorhodobacter antarcticus]